MRRFIARVGASVRKAFRAWWNLSFDPEMREKNARRVAVMNGWLVFVFSGIFGVLLGVMSVWGAVEFLLAPTKSDGELVLALIFLTVVFFAGSAGGYLGIRWGRRK